MQREIGKVFVLGAGLGTRLRPLTSHRPKPLVPVCNKPLITFAFDHVLAAGARAIFVNTHHCAERYDELLPTGEYRGCPVTLRHEQVLLDTGGGIRNVADLAGDDHLLVYNGDILTDLPLAPLIERHLAEDNDATLALRTAGGPRQVGFDTGSGRVLDIRGMLGCKVPEEFLFTGVYVVSPGMVKRIPADGPVSIVSVWLDMLRVGEGQIGGIVLDDGKWWDVGTVEQYLAVHRFFACTGYQPAFLTGGSLPEPVDASACVAADAVLAGATFLGAGAEVGPAAVLSDCVVWSGGVVEPGARLANCVVVDGARASGEADGGVFGRSAFRPDTAVERFIEKQARNATALSLPAGKNVSVTQLDKGGSDRSFFLVEPEGGEPLVALHYVGEQAGENARYVAVARFLAMIGVRAPRIMNHDIENGLVWMEYLGSDDLWNYRHARPVEKLALYRATLDQAIILHAHGLGVWRRDGGPNLHEGFDRALYLWEQDYFFERCLGGIFRIDGARLAALRSNSALEAVADELAGHPRSLIHRDFQSQNIMVYRGVPYLIDFQGMREGLPLYDVASLIEDPYVRLDEAEREELLNYYLDAARRAEVSLPGDWRRCYDLCATQRLMQALGAYGFLGLVKGRKSFLRHVAPAVRSLARVLARLPELTALRKVVEDLM